MTEFEKRVIELLEEIDRRLGEIEKDLLVIRVRAEADDPE